MKKPGAFSHYPLPEALTRRVVSYLSLFRLLISAALLYALFAGLISVSITLISDLIAGAVLFFYFVMAVILAVLGQKKSILPFLFAQIAVFIDVVILFEFVVEVILLIIYIYIFQF